MNASTDRDPILLTRRGDTDAYSELLARHQTGVFNVCYRILRNRSDCESIQEMHLRILKDRQP